MDNVNITIEFRQKFLQIYRSPDINYLDKLRFGQKLARDMHISHNGAINIMNDVLSECEHSKVKLGRNISKREKQSRMNITYKLANNPHSRNNVETQRQRLRIKLEKRKFEQNQ